jgi:rod shape determining protein RodA
MFDRRLLQNFDWALMGITLLICCMGMVSLYSAVGAGADSFQRTFYLKQLVWFGVGWVAIVVCFLIDYKKLERWGLPVFGITNLVLLAVLFFGRHSGGSRRWLSLGPLSIQPSEMAKLAVIIVLARYFARVVTSEGLTVRELLLPLV